MACSCSFFIRVLIDKKYALPYRVVDALVSHFLRFQTEQRTLPVVWHQCLLAFVQRYKFEIAAPDKERLQGLMRAQRHYLVTPEIVRELNSGHSRCARLRFACSSLRPPAHAWATRALAAARRRRRTSSPAAAGASAPQGRCD